MQNRIRSTCLMLLEWLGWNRIQRMSISTIQSSLSWLERWWQKGVKHWRSLFQFLSHYQASITFVLFLIPGYKLKLYTLFLFSILSCLRYIIFYDSVVLRNFMTNICVCDLYPMSFVTWLVAPLSLQATLMKFQVYVLHFAGTGENSHIRHIQSCLTCSHFRWQLLATRSLKSFIVSLTSTQSKLRCMDFLPALFFVASTVKGEWTEDDLILEHPFGKHGWWWRGSVVSTISRYWYC